MSDEKILGQLTEVIEDALDRPGISLTHSTKADDIKGWDSLAHVRILVSVEEAFGIRFSASEIAELRNVGDLITAIKHKIAN